MNQIEREYKNALDEVRFPQEAKERMMKNLMNQQEQTSVKRRGIRPLRAGLIAAAACAALLGTAGAVDLAARQSRVTYLDRGQFKQEYNEYLEKHGQSPINYSDGQYSGMDFAECDKAYWEKWWQGAVEISELVEETAGIPEDGWTAKRTFQCWAGGANYGLARNAKYLETRYQADQVSDLGSLFDLWDIPWLEEHYTTNPYGTYGRTITYGDDLRCISVGGEYEGRDGARFNMNWSWNTAYVHEDQFRVAGNKEYEELYTTPDGVVLAIEMDTSETGKSVFWVTLGSGHNSFDMFGTQMDLEDIHDILDSLNLSRVLEYAPAQ